MIGHLLETYGYLAVLVLVGLESLGLPLPGESALLTASAYAAAGHLSIIRVVVAAMTTGFVSRESIQIIPAFRADPVLHRG